MANYTENYDLVKPTMAETADIRTINGNMDTVDTIMHDTQVSMADAFDSTETYVIRDKVMYEFKLYQCIHPHTGPWDANNWERVNAAETGGNYVEITPTYNSGMKVADTNIDGDLDEIKVPYMTGATAQADGAGGVVPAPTAQDVGKYLDASGRWSTPSGGGGGTTVVPNPVGEPTDDLDTVQIGNTIYNIPGSGGGAGSSYKNLISQSITATGTYTLSESIENFDFIVVEMCDLVSGSGNPVVGSTWANVDNLKNNYNSGDYSIWVDGGNNDRSSSLSFTNATTISVTKASDSDAIVGIYGVKLGSGSGGSKTIYKASDYNGAPSLQDVPYDNGITLDGDEVLVVTYTDPTDASLFGTIVIPPSLLNTPVYYTGYSTRVNLSYFGLTSFYQQRVEDPGESTGYAPRVYQIDALKMGGGVGRGLLYTLDAGAAWRTFAPPNNTEIIIVETMGGYGIIDRREVNYTKLPSRSSGDNYVTVLNIPNAQGQAINMATNDSKDTIYISTAATYDMTNMYVKVYAKQGDY